MTDPSEPIVTAHTSPNLSPEAAEALDALVAVAKRQFACGLDHPHPGPCGTDNAPTVDQPTPSPAALVEARDPCPHCGDHQMIPRAQMAEHCARLHPDQPTTRDRLLHLADRARRGVALPAEHDALAAGITTMAAELRAALNPPKET